MDVQITPQLWAKPDKQGELKKKGHLVKNWKTRWFIIQNDMMFYFKSKGDQKPCGMIPLRGSYCKEETKSNKQNCFEINAYQINKVFVIQANNGQEVKDWIKAVQEGSNYSSVSAPYNVQHEIHVDFDSATGFSGLPPEWEVMLKTSGITREDVVANPQEALKVLEFQSNFQKETPNTQISFLNLHQQVQPLPEEQDITLTDLVSKQNPSGLYINMEKIGEGAAGEVFVANMPSQNNRKVAVKKNGNQR